MTRYLEDFAVGEKHVSAAVEVSEPESIEFARRYDPQPMHTDPELAARGQFGELRPLLLGGSALPAAARPVLLGPSPLEVRGQGAPLLIELE